MTQSPLLAQAVQHLRAGNPHAAIAPLRQAARQDPGNPVILHDLGLACLEAGDAPAAITALRAAVAARPEDADAHFRLGIALEQQGEAAAAVAAYDQATLHAPGLTEAWFRAGALVFTLGHPAEAALCFRRAAATGPKTPFGRLAKARALLAEGADAEAELVLRRLLAREPDHAMALELLGGLRAEAGDFAAAEACFTRAIAAAPLLAGAYYELVRCRRVTPQDGDLPARIEAALAMPGLPAAQRLRVHLALGKAADDLGDPARAMRHFDAASELRGVATPFDAAAFGTQIDRLIARFTPDLIAQASGLGSADATPVLIVGMPRSGTTLVEQIISSHPDVAAGGELNFWNERSAAWLLAGAADPAAPFLEQAAADYLRLLRGIGRKAARVTDKMPFNVLWAGLIHLALPRAPIIHCRRRAIDTALSIHQTHFNPHVAFPTGGPDLVAYFAAYDRLTAHWRRVLPADRFIELDYEVLTADPAPAIRGLIAACGLPWHDACLQPERNSRLVKTPSKWQARQPIYRGAADRWRRFEPYLGPLGALVPQEERVLF